MNVLPFKADIQLSKTFIPPQTVSKGRGTFPPVRVAHASTQISVRYTEVGTTEIIEEQYIHRPYLPGHYSLEVIQYHRDSRREVEPASPEEGWGDVGGTHITQEFASGTSGHACLAGKWVQEVAFPRCRHTRFATFPLLPLDHNPKLGKHKIPSIGLGNRLEG